MAETFLAEPEGSYSAELFTYDVSYSKNFKGLVTVTKFGDTFQVKIKYKNGPKGRHMQGLYAESFCTPFERLGPMLIPFDGDLTSLELGGEGYPTGPNFNYENEVSYSLMLANSNLHDRDLDLDGRSIVVHAGNTPAACGVLSRVEFSPEDDEPEVEINPHPRPHHPRTPEVQEQPPTVSESPRGGFFSRLWHRIGRWWRRVWGKDP